MAALAASIQTRPGLCAASGELSLRLGKLERPLGLPVLPGSIPSFSLDFSATTLRRAGDFTIVEREAEILGFASMPAREALEEHTRTLYHQIFAFARDDWQLHRIWNLVPDINEATDGLEHYRSFCLGRARAFEEAFGSSSTVRMPAASGVGSRNGQLSVAFVCGRGKPVHLENPHQVPAYRYPPEYGPRSPSFARATVAGKRAFISGTAAIRGHSSLAIGDLSGQLEVTLQNLRAILRKVACRSGCHAPTHRHGVVYLRHAADLSAAQAFFSRHLFQEHDSILYLQADLCRRELLVEVEITDHYS